MNSSSLKKTGASPSKPFNLPRYEMAFRQIYQPFLKNRELKVVFRPGKRVCESYRGYCLGEIITARILSKVGADWAEIKPVFFKNIKFKIKIDKMEVISFEDLKEEHFVGSSPDVYDAKSLAFHLGVIYNLPMNTFVPGYKLTRITFSYID